MTRRIRVVKRYTDQAAIREDVLVVEARVLTVKQPWAWAILGGGKDVENRSWSTRYRGPPLIHAGIASDRAGYANVVRLSPTRPPEVGAFRHGAILGVVELVDCVRDSDSPWAEPGDWHWCLRDPEPLSAPVPCKGRLGLWRPPPGVAW